MRCAGSSSSRRRSRTVARAGYIPPLRGRHHRACRRLQPMALGYRRDQQHAALAHARRSRRRRARADAHRGWIHRGGPQPRQQPARRRARARVPPRGHRLLQARPRSGRPRALRDSAQPLRTGPCRGARDRARRPAARPPCRDGAGEPVLPHPRDGTAGVRARDRPPRPPQHHHGGAQRGLEKADPQRTPAVRYEAGAGDDHRARHARRRRHRTQPGRRSRKARRSSSGRWGTAATGSSAACSPANGRRCGCRRRSPRCACASTRCRPARTRTTSPPLPTGRSGTRLSTRGSSAGSIPRPGK